MAAVCMGIEKSGEYEMIMATSLFLMYFLCLGICSGCVTRLGQEKPEESSIEWKTPDPHRCSPEERPIIEILSIIAKKQYEQRIPDIGWDENVSYFEWEWKSPKMEKARRDRIYGTRNAPPVQLQWKEVIFFRTKEFAKVRVRAINIDTGNTYFKGTCLFRKLREGWRMNNCLPIAVQIGDYEWNEIIANEINRALRRAEASKLEGLPVPHWSGTEEIMRLIKILQEEYAEKGMFPLSVFLDHLTSDNMELRRYVYKTLVKTFNVDYGYSENKLCIEDVDWEEQIKWVRPWYDWAYRKYGKDAVDRFDRGVPLPGKDRRDF